MFDRKAVADQFKKIGLEPGDVFVSGDISAYRKHRWILAENDRFTVVNAVPQEQDADVLFWEEWYRENSEIHHHILTLYRPDKYDAVWNAPAADDGLHPSICFGRVWYVVEETSMQAMLQRR